MFTYQYMQPDEYHFSLDSIQFPEFVAKQIESHPDLKSMRVLDLCAGCGVIGFQLSWYLRELTHFDFIEVQEIYTHYFHQNAAIVNRPELKLQWHQFNYDRLLEKEWANKYDLIISNPPYFFPEQGMLSPSDFKNRCRFYLDSSFANFIKAITNSLANGGMAYFLLRPLTHHGNNLLFDIQELLQNLPITLEKASHMRGADIILLKKS